MPRLLSLTDRDKRDAQVAIEGPRRPPARRYVASDGRSVSYERLILTTEGHDYTALRSRYGDDDALAKALISEDPEIDQELCGRRVGAADRVFLRPDGSVLYSARVLKVTYDPDGEELERAEFIDVEASVDEGNPLPWTGRLFDTNEVVRRFVLGRKLQLRHINGLTFDFLFEIARFLHDEKKMLFMGSGTKGTDPLVFQRNGSPYRGFLEGRVFGDGFVLVLHLSNLELRRP